MTKKLEVLVLSGKARVSARGEHPSLPLSHSRINTRTRYGYATTTGYERHVTKILRQLTRFGNSILTWHYLADGSAYIVQKQPDWIDLNALHLAYVIPPNALSSATLPRLIRRYISAGGPPSGVQPS